MKHLSPEELLPLIKDRKARCGLNCGKIVDSDPMLAFFEYRGEGSQFAIDTCKNCMFHFEAHEKKQAGTLNHPDVCDNFVPHGAHEFDLFYNGCKGWD